jgi:ubiquinone/menaquinone biosynthesis C-methylase UbiE
VTSPGNNSVLETADIVTSSDDYARRFEGEVGEWFLEMQARIVLDLLRHLPTNSTIVDVGGGHGQLTPTLLQAGYRVLVIGSSPVCSVRLKAWVDGEQCRFQVANLHSLPFGASTFDAALCLRLLPHSVSWTTLVRELCRVARDSVILDYPSTRSINIVSSQLFSLKRSIERNTRPFTLFHPRQIREEFQANGFVLAAERPQFLFPMVLHRWAGAVKLSRIMEASGRYLGLTRWLGSPILARADRVRR